MAAKKQWTKEEEKKFEQSLAIYTERSPYQFENIALFLKKPVAKVKEHYEALSRDLFMIESGLLDEPVNMCLVLTNPISLGSKHEVIKRKRWSEDEHRRFLIGLERYGKGDWRGISRNVVMTRTPLQVASHAQKYFKRQNLSENKKKWSSINDSTSLPAPVSNMDSTTQDETPIPLQSQPWQQQP